MKREYKTEEVLNEELPKVDAPVYGDTDFNPNRDDQEDAHHADEDEHV